MYNLKIYIKQNIFTLSAFFVIAILVIFLNINSASAAVTRQEGLFIDTSFATSSWTFGVTAGKSVYQQMVVDNCVNSTSIGTCEISGITIPIQFADSYTTGATINIYQWDGTGNLADYGGNIPGDLTFYSTLIATGNISHPSGSPDYTEAQNIYFTGGNIYISSNEEYFIQIEQNQYNTLSLTTMDYYDSISYAGNLYSKYIRTSDSRLRDLSALGGTDWIYQSFLDDDLIIDWELYSGDNFENYDYELSQTWPDFNTVANQVCVIGEECKLWFSFNSLAIGYEMYLLDYDGISAPPYAIASTTVTASQYWQNYVVVPNNEIEENKKYNFLLDAETYGWVNKTGISIDWISQASWSEIIDVDSEGYCSEESVCASVATSSDFFFGVTCGMRKTACWLLVPTDNSRIYITDSITKLENSFPFNLYFSFINKTENIISNTSTSTAENLGVPFVNQEGEFIILDVISSSTMPNTLGSSYDTVRQNLIYLIWIAFTLLIINIIYKVIV